jgi:hypothetical protein
MSIYEDLYNGAEAELVSFVYRNGMFNLNDRDIALPVFELGQFPE